MPPYMDRIWCNTSNTPLTTLNLDKVSVNTLCSADPSESKVSGPQYTSWGHLILEMQHSMTRQAKQTIYTNLDHH